MSNKTLKSTPTHSTFYQRNEIRSVSQREIRMLFFLTFLVLRLRVTVLKHSKETTSSSRQSNHVGVSFRDSFGIHIYKTNSPYSILTFLYSSCVLFNYI